MNSKNHPSIWDLEVSSVSLSHLLTNEFKSDPLRLKRIMMWLVKNCRFNKKFRKSFARELADSERLAKLGELLLFSQQHKKSLGTNVTASELRKNKLDVYVDAMLKADPEQQVGLPFFSASLGRIRDQYEEIFFEDSCRAVRAGELRDEIFENVFARRIEVANEVMIVDQYGFDGSPRDKHGLKWFIKMIHKSKPELPNLKLVSAFSKEKFRLPHAELKKYKLDLFDKMNSLVDHFDWGGDMQKHLAVVDPDDDTHQIHIYIDGMYRYTWDYRFRYFSHEKTSSDQKIHFSCSFGSPDTPDSEWYRKFSNKTKLLQAV